MTYLTKTVLTAAQKKQIILNYIKTLYFKNDR